MTKQPGAAIVGGGIAGLCAAIGLERNGFPVTVFERAPEPRVDGGVLILWTNASNALRELGLLDAVVDRGTVVHTVDFRRWDGELLWQMPVGEYEQRYGAPSLFIRRSDLLEVLLDAFGRGRVRCDALCTGFAQDALGVRPLFADPAAPEEVFDCLIGADGLRSAIRRQLLDDGEPRSAHHVGWVGVATTDATRWPHPAGISQIVLGPGLRFCTATMKERPQDGPGVRTVYWYVTEKVSRLEGRDGLIGRRELVALCRDCALPVSGLIERTEELLPFKVNDRWPARRWGEGRTSLVGDAAHVSTPDLGQGACQAIEDAVALARQLGGSGDVEAALRRYERARMPRTALITHVSRAATFHSMLTLPGSDRVRNLAMKLLMPPFAGSQFHTILGHRV